MSGFRGLCLGLVVGIVAALAWTDARLNKYQAVAEQAAQDAHAKVSLTQAAYAESVLKVRRDTVRLTKWFPKYDTIRDTISALLADDTVQTVPSEWVRQLITVGDSTVAACRDLVGSTRGALTACDSTQSALRSELGITKSLYAAEKRRSKLRRALPWIAGAAGFWAGAKLRVP